MPKRNSEYWSTKFRRNIERDRENSENLQEFGWQVMRIWEHEVKNPELAEYAVARVIDSVRARKDGA